jgi:hypothetical protein
VPIFTDIMIWDGPSHFEPTVQRWNKCQKDIGLLVR